jgi:glycosyltransferase involved in cell wall biosynthesis
MQTDCAVEYGGKRFAKAGDPDHPLFSVITVVFNGEKVLESTILSVLDQTYRNVEYIIVDGKSTDATVDIVRKYEDSIDYWVSEPDSGIYDAMNKGIRHARGEWLYFLNCGDCFVDSEVLGNVALAAACTDLPLVIGRVNYFSGKMTVKQLPETVPTENTARALYASKFCHQAFFARRGSYIATGGYDTRFPVFSDFHTAYRIIRDGGGFHRVDLTIANFDGGGVSSDPRRALRLYCEAEEVFTALGEPRTAVGFWMGYVRAWVYKVRRHLVVNFR